MCEWGWEVIKEIVDIGRVSNELGSVFTFNRVPEFYGEVCLEDNDKDFKFITNYKPQEILDIEEYLNFGLFRGKSGSNIFIFPSSLLIDITCDYSKLKEIEGQLSEVRDKKEHNKIKKQYDSELKKFKTDKENFEKQVISGEKVLKKFIEEYKKQKLTDCKEKVDELLKIKEFKTAKDKNSYKKLLIDKCNSKYKAKRESKLLNYLKSILQAIHSNSEDFIKVADICKKYIIEKSDVNNIKRIPIILKIRKKNSDNSYFIHNKYFIFKLYENLIFNNSTQKLKNKKDDICNIYNIKDELFAPRSSFYYAYSLDKVNVYPNLSKQDTVNVFNLSKQAYLDFMSGRTFLETFNSFYFVRLNCYITATSLNDNSLKEFQKDVKEAKSNLEGLINLIDKNLSNRFDVLLNFYFFEPTKTGNNIIEYIKDIIPSKLVQAIKFSNSLREFYQEQFDRENFKYNWQQQIYNIYYKDNHKKYRTSLFRQIALGDKIDLDRLLLVINDNMQYGVLKNEEDDIVKKNKFPRDNAFFYMINGKEYRKVIAIKHLMFLDWLDKINKGAVKMSRDEKKQEFFEGKTYEERLGYFLDNANLVKESQSMKLGICVGLALNILSWSINGYDKKTLAFVGKRIERNNLSSVQAFVNEIFAKTKFHGFESLQSVNIRLATNQMLYLDNNSFNKDEFIFGLFLGNELYRNVKSEKDPEIPTEIQDEGDDNNENN